MKTTKQSKLKRSPEQTEARVTGNANGAAIEVLDVPKFLVRLVGRDNVKRFSVPIIIRNRHD